jgi:uncharacterized protein YjdB
MNYVEKKTEDLLLMKRILAILLAVVMIATMLPTAFAYQPERAPIITAILDEEELIQGMAYPVGEFEIITGIWFPLNDDGTTNEDFYAYNVTIYDSRTGEAIEELGTLSWDYDDYGIWFIDSDGEIIQPFESDYTTPEIPFDFEWTAVIYAGNENNTDFWWVNTVVSGFSWQIYAVTFSDVITCDCGCCEECDLCGVCEVCAPIIPCTCLNCTKCGFLGGHYGFGKVMGGTEVAIVDVLEVLMFLATLTSVIDDNPNAKAAAIIINPGISTEPTISDVLEMLKHLAKLPNKIDIPNLDDVRIESRNIELRINQTHTLNTNLRGEIRFESMNPQVATITRASGTITAVANSGNTHILVRADGIVRAIYQVVILPSTTAVSMVGLPEVMSVGESVGLTSQVIPSGSVDRVTMSVDNSSIANITRNNELRALARGSVTLTVTSGNVSADYTIIVESPSINETSIMLIEKENQTLRINGNSRTVQWRSSNPSVATIDQNGRITAHQAGYTCIIATVGQIEYYCDVRVITPLEKRISDVQLKYPDGYFWNNHTPDSQFPNVSKTPCSHQIDSPRRCKGQCAGFAHLVSNEVFGTSPSRIPVANVESVRQGDYVRYSRRAGHNHSIFIIRVEQPGEIIGYDRRNGTHIYATRLMWIVTDCNWWSDCGIIWYRRFDPSTFVTYFNAQSSYSRF